MSRSFASRICSVDPNWKCTYYTSQSSLCKYSKDWWVYLVNSFRQSESFKHHQTRLSLALLFTYWFQIKPLTYNYSHSLTWHVMLIYTVFNGKAWHKCVITSHRTSWEAFNYPWADYSMQWPYGICCIYSLLKLLCINPNSQTWEVPQTICSHETQGIFIHPYIPLFAVHRIQWEFIICT